MENAQIITPCKMLRDDDNITIIIPEEYWDCEFEVSVYNG